MQFLYPRCTLVECSVYSCCNGQCATNDGAHAGQEAGECFAAFFAIDYFHGGDVVAEEDAWDAAPVIGVRQSQQWQRDGGYSYLACNFSLCPSAASLPPLKLLL